MPYLRLVKRVISLEGKGIVTELEITEGMKLEKGFISPYFTNTEKMEVSYDNPYILLTDKRITLVQQDITNLRTDN
jgi:chaperonin GroEL